MSDEDAVVLEADEVLLADKVHAALQRQAAHAARELDGKPQCRDTAHRRPVQMVALDPQLLDRGGEDHGQFALIDAVSDRRRATPAWRIELDHAQPGRQHVLGPAAVCAGRAGANHQHVVALARLRMANGMAEHLNGAVNEACAGPIRHAAFLS